MINGEHSNDNGLPPDASKDPNMADGATIDAPDVQKIKGLINVVKAAQKAVNSSPNVENQLRDNLQELRKELQGLRLGDLEKWLDDLNALFDFHYSDSVYVANGGKIIPNKNGRTVGILLDVTNVKQVLMQLNEEQAGVFITSFIQAGEIAFARAVQMVKPPSLILPNGG